MVLEFHKKNGYNIGSAMFDLHTRTDNGWHIAGFILCCVSWCGIIVVKLLQRLANKMQAHGDTRMYRFLLMLEEVCEIGLGLYKDDELEVADGLADLLYVTYGAGVTYYIPLDEVFAEVHRANMSKKTRDEKADPRMRDKGEWTPPCIQGAIYNGRIRMIKEESRGQSCS
jgi:phosphoribosyl-ATP pyrophosphohydrolase